ncbi:MAG TPA: ATP-binding protein, partial [Actinomycetes bacterium]|nr:ATP-binding protein [Actinomycetes bacterium]
MVGNLIDNAVDAALAAPAPRQVMVTIRQDDTDLLVRVADTGPGLDPGRLEQAFSRGWSTKAGGRPHGRGLGLALVRQVVARHDGRVAVANEDGAVFTIRLPLAATAARAAKDGGL